MPLRRRMSFLSAPKKRHVVATLVVAMTVLAVTTAAWGRDDVFRIYITRPIEPKNRPENVSSVTNILEIGSDVGPNISLKLQRYIDSKLAPQARVIHEVSTVPHRHQTISASLARGGDQSNFAADTCYSAYFCCQLFISVSCIVYTDANVFQSAVLHIICIVSGLPRPIALSNPSPSLISPIPIPLPFPSHSAQPPPSLPIPPLLSS